jgi:hypothetical protein
VYVTAAPDGSNSHRVRLLARRVAEARGDLVVGDRLLGAGGAADRRGPIGFAARVAATATDGGQATIAYLRDGTGVRPPSRGCPSRTRGACCRSPAPS